MKFIISSLIVIFGALKSVDAGASKLIINTIDVKTLPNPYWDDWSAIVHPGGEKLTLKMPFKAEIPDDMMLKLDFSMGAETIHGLDVTVCEGLESVTIKTLLGKYGEPKDKFPKECPITAIGELVLKEYAFPDHVLPPYQGDVSGVVSLYQPGSEPIVTLTATGQMMLDMPGVPKMGFGR